MLSGWQETSKGQYLIFWPPVSTVLLVFGLYRGASGMGSSESPEAATLYLSWPSSLEFSIVEELQSKFIGLVFALFPLQVFEDSFVFYSKSSISQDNFQSPSIVLHFSYLQLFTLTARFLILYQVPSLYAS